MYLAIFAFSILEDDKLKYFWTAKCFVTDIFTISFFRKIGTISVTKKDGFVVYQDGQMNKRCVLFRIVELATATVMELVV